MIVSCVLFFLSSFFSYSLKLLFTDSTCYHGHWHITARKFLLHWDQHKWDRAEEGCDDGGLRRIASWAQVCFFFHLFFIYLLYTRFKGPNNRPLYFDAQERHKQLFIILYCCLRFRYVIFILFYLLMFIVFRFKYDKQWWHLHLISLPFAPLWYFQLCGDVNENGPKHPTFWWQQPQQKMMTKTFSMIDYVYCTI